MDLQTSVILLLFFSLAASIKGPPIASQKRIQKLARLGEDVKLFCPMEGSPAPIIEWSKGEVMVDYQMTRYRTNKKSLKIKNADIEDSGRFICKGINGFGKSEIQIDLIIIDPVDFPGLGDGELPEVTPPVLTSDTLSSRERLLKSVGETLRVACGALGKPQPRITWYKNGHEVLEHVREKQGRSVLQLRGLLARDAATYSCVARNMVGEARRDFTLSMEEEGGDQPAFSHGPMNRTVREGETATFDCRVRSAARPHIKWLKKLEASDLVAPSYNLSEVIDVGVDRYRLMTTSTDALARQGETLSQLVLRRVEPGDAGTYVCFVTSPQGAFNHIPAFLTVIPGSRSLVEESPPLLVLVVSLSILVLLVLLTLIACLVRRRTKEPLPPPETPEVHHSLMPPHLSAISSLPAKSEQPLPPPPTPTPWAHLYSTSCTSSSHYEGPTYEVPHPHPGGKAPAPSLSYGYTGEPFPASAYSYNPSQGYYAEKTHV